MRLFLIAMLAGGAWGRLRGGCLHALASVSLPAPVLLPAALLLQLALGTPPLASMPNAARFFLVLVSYALAGVWLVVGARAGPPILRPAFALFAIGWAMNVVVMVPNGGMPVSPSALAELGLPRTTDVQEGYLSKHVSASRTTVLWVLGDVIPAPILRSVLSLGDLVLALGLSSAVACGMRAGMPAGLRPDSPDSPDGVCTELEAPL